MHETDRNRLAKALISHNYFRLSRYWRYFQEAPHLGETRFVPTASVDGLLMVYEFDRVLRQLLISGLGDVEVAFRSRLAHFIATEMGPYAHLDRRSYAADSVTRRSGSVSLRDELIEGIRAEVMRSLDDGVARYADEPSGAPIWAAVEAMSMGSVSKLYRLVASDDVRFKVSRSFGLPNPAFAESVFRSLTVLRNVCAHHGRIWNTRPTISPRVLNALKVERDRSIYDQTPWAWIVMSGHLADGVRGDSTCSEALWSYIDAHPDLHDGLKYPHRR
jgi:abortive infection bacteriophage resistance protein